MCVAGLFGMPGGPWSPLSTPRVLPPGTDPLNSTGAFIPAICTEIGCGGWVTIRLIPITPSTPPGDVTPPPGDVTPSPVAYRTTDDPGGTGFCAEFTLPKLSATTWP